MLEVLEFYVSGFWVWFGITLGVALLTHGVAVTTAIIAQSIRRD